MTSIAPSPQNSDALLKISPTAQVKLAELLAEAGDEVSAIRVFVSGGGCSGVSYGMTYTDEVTDQDRVIEAPGVKVVLDAMALGYLQGAEIDFTTDSLNPAFVFRNAYQAKSGGGCGGGGGGCGGGGGGCGSR